MDSDDPTPNAREHSQSGVPVSEDQPSGSTELAATPPVKGNAAPNSVTPNNSGRCLLYGCSVVFISGLFLILCAGFATYYYFTQQVKEFTSETALVLPAQEYDEQKMVELEMRVQEFEQTFQTIEIDSEVVLEEAKKEAVDAQATENPADHSLEVSQPTPMPKPRAKTQPKQLVLSAADLNALIARKPQFRNRLFVKIEEGVISGDVSLPLDDFLPGGKGRFFNGSGTFDVSLQEGELVVRLTDAMVGGKPIPPVVMSEIRKQNLASEFQKDARVSRSLQRFEQVEVKRDRMILTLKQPSTVVTDQKQ